MKLAALLAVLAVLAVILWRRGGTARRVQGADGRWFIQISAATPPGPDGVSQSSVWRTDPDDGVRYSSNLSFDLGVDDVPMFSRFV